MKTIRLVLVLSLVLAGAALRPAAADEPRKVVAPVGPKTLAELEKALRAESERLEKLLALAAKDKRFRLVETYKAYTIEDFSKTRGRVEAIDLLDIVSDAKAPMDLRKEAFEVLKSKQAKSFDPDLARTRGRKKPRNEFFLRNVTKLLMAKSVWARRYAHELLIEYYPAYKMDTDVIAYNPEDGSRTQWKKARTHWEKLLR